MLPFPTYYLLNQKNKHSLSQFTFFTRVNRIYSWNVITIADFLSPRNPPFPQGDVCLGCSKLRLNLAVTVRPCKKQHTLSFQTPNKTHFISLFFFSRFLRINHFGHHYQNPAPHSAQESGRGHYNFTPEKDDSKILITWHKEMRQQPLLVRFFQI